MAIKTVNILCVNNSSLSQQLEISEKESIRNVKSKMELVEARFVYGGRELLEDEDLFELILEGTTIHMVVSGSGYAGTGESSKQQSSSKPEPLPTKLPETTTETTSCGVDLYLAPMFSLVPITPQIVTINGMLYRLETGPGVQVSIPQSTPQTPPPVPIRERLAAINPGITLDIFWIVAKLTFAVYFLSRGASVYRTAVLSISAFIVFLYQAGIVGGAPVRVQPAPEQPPPAQNMPQPEAQPEEEGLLANDNVQEPEPALAPNVVPQPRTLLGRISFVALSFFASLIPGQPLPDYGLLQ